MYTRQKAQNELLSRPRVSGCVCTDVLNIPAKKLLFPDPFRPTTTLCLGENGSICVWSLSVRGQVSRAGGNTTVLT
jgi:hypothetical protein